MNVRFVAVVLTACGVLLGSSPLLARDSGLLTPAEKRAYHACLYASFIDNYCRFNAWGSSDSAFRECLIANGAGTIPIHHPYWGPGIENVCRDLVQAHGF